MKDRFIKVMLVIIAGLLLLNYFKDNNGGNSVFGGTKVEASVPTFFQVGKSYHCVGGIVVTPSLDNIDNIKVTRVDPPSGWIEEEGRYGKLWHNTAQYGTCKELNSTQK